MTEKTAISTNGKKGGNLVGKPHRNKSGEDVGGIKAVVTDANNQPVELEGGEVIINKAASKKYWKELSRINQSAGNGVPINKPVDPIDEDPTEYEKGGKIEFNANKIPNKWILAYAEKIKSEHPEIWKLGGNIFGNEAFENLKRVAKRGYWLDEERWMYIKWQSFVARHKQDFRIAGVVAMLKWVDKVDKGWAYMKELIESEIQKKSKKKGFTKKLSTGGNLKNDCIDFIMKSEPITKNGYYLHIKNLNAYVDSGDKTISNIKSLVLITYNSGGQSNLKASNTVNASELSSEIAKLLDCKITVARIIVSEQIKSAKRFSLNILKSIQHENIVVADRDKIVCTNINAQYKQGGKVDSYKDKYNRKYNYEKNTSHSLEDIAKDSGVSIKGIQQIYNKGIGAYKTNPQSVRPNVKSKEQWAMARVYSSVMGGKASIVDKNELKLSKGGNLMSITRVVLTDFNVKKYFGQYKKVFNAFNKDSLGFTEGAYELDSSGERDNNGNYILLISQYPDSIVQDRLDKIRGISYEIIDIENNKNYFEKGGRAYIGEPIEFYQRTHADGSIERFSVEDYETNIFPSLQKELKMEKGGETPAQQAKISQVMSEYKNRTLKTSYGETVTDDKQAIAIAVSEAGIKKYAKGGKLADNFIVLESVGSIMDTNGFGTFYPMFKNGQPDLDNGTKYSELKGTDFINNLSSEDNNTISFYADKFIERYQFFTYVSDYYGKNGMYKDDYEGGFTEDQIEEAVLKYIADPKTNWGGGDTVDRELTRDKYLVPLLSKSSTNRDEYFVGDTGFYNGKTRVPIEITKISGKNVYFKDGDGNIKRSEKRNFERLYEASNTNSNRPVVSKPIAPKPIKNKPTKSVTKKATIPEPVVPIKNNQTTTTGIDYFDLLRTKLEADATTKIYIPTNDSFMNSIINFTNVIDEARLMSIEEIQDIRSGLVKLIK
jgi:hypothetical protein